MKISRFRILDIMVHNFWISNYLKSFWDGSFTWRRRIFRFGSFQYFISFLFLFSDFFVFIEFRIFGHYTGFYNSGWNWTFWFWIKIPSFQSRTTCTWWWCFGNNLIFFWIIIYCRHNFSGLKTIVSFTGIHLDGVRWPRTGAISTFRLPVFEK